MPAKMIKISAGKITHFCRNLKVFHGNYEEISNIDSLCVMSSCKTLPKKAKQIPLDHFLRPL